MTADIDIKAISRILQKMERAQEERTRRAYKPAKISPEPPAAAAAKPRKERKNE